MSKLLKDVRVLDLTQFQAGPVCTRVLADFGAEVIKIEPPWGEALRFLHPVVGGESPGFLSYNRNKKSIVLNLKSEKGVRIFKELVKHADIVVENFSVGTMDRLGLGYDALKEINPGIIYSTITGFGYSGPFSSRLSFDIIAQALSGLMTLTGSPEQPILVPDYIGDPIPALVAAIGVLLALYYRKETGKGQRVDVAQLDSMVYILSSITSYLLTGKTNKQLRGQYPIGVYNAFRAKDGFVAVASGGPLMLERMSKVLGIEEVNETIMTEWVEKQTVEEVVAKLTGARVPAAPVLSVEKVVVHPQLIARDMIVEVDHPKAGRIKTVGVPIKLSESPGMVEAPPPTLGQHTEEVLSQLLGYGQEKIVKLREEKVIF